jgi:hypothetical protein
MFGGVFNVLPSNPIGKGIVYVKRVITSGLANGLEPQSRFHGLFRIAGVSLSESRTTSDAKPSTKHMLIPFSGD